MYSVQKLSNRFDTGLAFVLHYENRLADEPAAGSNKRPNFFRTISNSSQPHSVAHDDPFSPNAVALASAELCLDLEMLRHKDLVVQRTVELACSSSQSSPKKGQRGIKSRFESLKKGKEKVEVDTRAEVDIRVYWDERCLATTRWLESKFCLDQVHIRPDVQGDAY